MSLAAENGRLRADILSKCEQAGRLKMSLQLIEQQLAPAPARPQHGGAS
jgi:hypothetical protein